MAAERSDDDARRALLGRVIDHAPLFPPASMTMEDALAEDRRVREGDTGWLVGRFVCPASRIAELGDVGIELSLVVDGDTRLLPLADARVKAFEFPPGTDPVDVGSREAYVELPPDERLSSQIGALSDLGLRAKVRCGGKKVPSVPELAAFVRLCREWQVPFKATAGLHHAVRNGDDHGFLNLLAAAVFGDEEAALVEHEPDAFRLDADAFTWRGRRADAARIARVRERHFVGFGSCDAQEPADELAALGLL